MTQHKDEHQKTTLENLREQNNNEKIVPQEPAGGSPTDSDGSMSQGNLSNSRYSRERSAELHDKTVVTGSDRDGQAE